MHRSQEAEREKREKKSSWRGNFLRTRNAEQRATDGDATEFELQSQGKKGKTQKTVGRSDHRAKNCGEGRENGDTAGVALVRAKSDVLPGLSCYDLRLGVDETAGRGSRRTTAAEDAATEEPQTNDVDTVRRSPTGDLPSTREEGTMAETQADRHGGSAGDDSMMSAAEKSAGEEVGWPDGPALERRPIAADANRESLTEQPTEGVQEGHTLISQERTGFCGLMNQPETAGVSEGAIHGHGEDERERPYVFPRRTGEGEHEEAEQHEHESGEKKERETVENDRRADRRPLQGVRGVSDTRSEAMTARTDADPSRDAVQETVQGPGGRLLRSSATVGQANRHNSCGPSYMQRTPGLPFPHVLPSCLHPSSLSPNRPASTRASTQVGDSRENGLGTNGEKALAGVLSSSQVSGTVLSHAGSTALSYFGALWGLGRAFNQAAEKAVMSNSSQNAYATHTVMPFPSGSSPSPSVAGTGRPGGGLEGGRASPLSSRASPGTTDMSLETSARLAAVGSHGRIDSPGMEEDIAAVIRAAVCVCPLLEMHRCSRRRNIVFNGLFDRLSFDTLWSRSLLPWMEALAAAVKENWDSRRTLSCDRVECQKWMPGSGEEVKAARSGETAEDKELSGSRSRRPREPDAEAELGELGKPETFEETQGRVERGGGRVGKRQQESIGVTAVTQTETEHVTEERMEHQLEVETPTPVPPRRAIPGGSGETNPPSLPRTGERRTGRLVPSPPDRDAGDQEKETQSDKELSVQGNSPTGSGLYTKDVGPSSEQHLSPKKKREDGTLEIADRSSLSQVRSEAEVEASAARDSHLSARPSTSSFLRWSPEFPVWLCCPCAIQRWIALYVQSLVLGGHPLESGCLTSSALTDSVTSTLEERPPGQQDATEERNTGRSFNCQVLPRKVPDRPSRRTTGADVARPLAACRNSYELDCWLARHCLRIDWVPGKAYPASSGFASTGPRPEEQGRQQQPKNQVLFREECGQERQRAAGVAQDTSKDNENRKGRRDVHKSLTTQEEDNRAERRMQEDASLDEREVVVTRGDRRRDAGYAGWEVRRRFPNGVADFYEETAAGGARLDAVPVPVLIVMSMDDPISDYEGVDLFACCR